MSRTPLKVSGLVSNTTFSTWPNLLSTTPQDVWFKFGLILGPCSAILYTHKRLNERRGTRAACQEW
jgi:hypothetical protein